MKLTEIDYGKRRHMAIFRNQSSLCLTKHPDRSPFHRFPLRWSLRPCIQPSWTWLLLKPF